MGLGISSPCCLAVSALLTFNSRLKQTLFSYSCFCWVFYHSTRKRNLEASTCSRVCKHPPQGMQAPAPGHAFHYRFKFFTHHQSVQHILFPPGFFLVGVAFWGIWSLHVHFQFTTMSLFIVVSFLFCRICSNIHFFIHCVSELNLFSVHLAKAAADTKIRPFYASKCCSTKLYPCSVSIYLFTYFSLFMG